MDSISLFEMVELQASRYILGGICSGRLSIDHRHHNSMPMVPDNYKKLRQRDENQR